MIGDLQADLWTRAFNEARPIRASGVWERPPYRLSLRRSHSRVKNPRRSPHQSNPTLYDLQLLAITVHQILLHLAW
jgi:hypothetical protein